MKYQLFNKERKEVNEYIQYMLKRNSIWKQKYIDLSEKIEYNGDEIMSKYHFCNIWRDIDNFSKQEIKMIKGLPLIEQIKIIAIGRHTLSVDTTKLLLDGATLERIYEHWEHCKLTGKIFVSNAISMYPKEGTDRAIEITRHRDQVFKYAYELEESIKKGKNAMYLLSKIPSLFDYIGVFRAYEIYTSLTYSEHVSYKEDDVFLVGPGAIDGLTFVTGIKFNSTDCDSALIDLCEIVKSELEQHEEFYWIPENMQGSVNNKEKHKFTVRTLEDSLCEFRKYCSLRAGKGKHRKYIRN